MFKKPNIKLHSGCKVYAVGGCIRDHFLGRDPEDVDYVVVGATEQDMLDAGLIKVGAEFHVYLNEEWDEFALARTERKVNKGYKGFVTEIDGVTLEDDLRRRDFTMNAIAYDFETGEFIDPLNGIQDIKDKVVRMANEHAFVEDPLRIIRLARFTSRLPDFFVDGYTIHTIQKMLHKEEELASIPRERITLEFEKMWKQSSPSSICEFFHTLDNCGVLEILVPELYALKKVRENPERHPEGNTFLHTLLALKQAKTMNLGVNEFWMLLTHDFGKILTADTEAHHSHDKDGVPIVEVFCDRFRLSNYQTNLCKIFCEHHMRLARLREMRSFTIAKMFNLFKVDHTDEILNSMVMCSFADQTGRDMDCSPSFTTIEIENIMRAYRNITGEHVIEQFKGWKRPAPKGREFKHELSILRAKEISKFRSLDKEAVSE